MIEMAREGFKPMLQPRTRTARGLRRLKKAMRSFWDPNRHNEGGNLLAGDAASHEQCARHSPGLWSRQERDGGRGGTGPGLRARWRRGRSGRGGRRAHAEETAEEREHLGGGRAMKLWLLWGDDFLDGRGR